jgi:type IV fimbrial biogenesis protein FimT
MGGEPDLLGSQEGWLVLNRIALRGFTLVEVMVVLTIVGIVLAFGTPSFVAYLQGAKLASSAQSYLSGVQLARAEAIRRNLLVQFVLTDTPVATANFQNAAVLSVTGQNWLVRVFNPTTAVFDLIEAKSALEGSYSSSGTAPVQIAGTATPPAVFDGSISFSGFGGTTTGGVYALDLQNPSGGACAPAGPMRCPRIRVAAGGRALLCDPIVAAGDSRAC